MTAPESNDHVTDNRRTLGAVILFILAGVVFAAMIVLLVNRTLDVSTLNEDLTAARGEIEELRRSNMVLSRRIRSLTDTALDNRTLLRDILKELDREDRERIREQIAASSSADGQDTRRGKAARAQREPTPQPMPSPRPPRPPDPRPDPPGEPDPPPDPPVKVCVPVLNVCVDT